VRLLIDPGDIGAPPGSPRWAIAVHGEACASKQRGQAAVSNLQAWLRMLRRDNNFRLLFDADDRPFATWEDFVQYREPFGLGMRVEVANAVLAEKDQTRLLSDVVASAQTAMDNGGDRRSAAWKDQFDSIKLKGRPSGKGGTSSDYLAARLKRDAPDIAARIDDFPSIRAAAKAAGIIRDRTPLELLRSTWRKASAEERSIFLTEIGAA
jgi:hypothetical protein